MKVEERPQLHSTAKPNDLSGHKKGPFARAVSETASGPTGAQKPPPSPTDEARRFACRRDYLASLNGKLGCPTTVLPKTAALPWRVRATAHRGTVSVTGAPAVCTEEPGL